MRYLGDNFRQRLRGYTERVASPSISGGALTLDLSLAGVFTVSRNGNMTSLTISNVPPTGRTTSFSLRLTGNGSSYTWTWPGSVRWPGGVAPTITTTNGKRDWFTFVTTDGGTSWDAFISGQNF